MIKSNINGTKLDVFKKLYYDLKDAIQKDKDIKERDITQEVFKYIRNKVNYKELVNINIRGEPGTGKSTIGLTLMAYANKIIEKKFNKKIDNYKWIAGDQIEFMRLTKLKEENVCTLIDEQNPMGRTGANATTEQAEYEFFSHLGRQYYIHKIACTPINIIDPNAAVIMDVIGKNEDTGTTEIKILYRDLLEGNVIALGTAHIYVGDTIKKDWYRKYIEKKRAKTDLLQKYGIRDVRELEFAEIGLEVIGSLIHVVADLQKGSIMYYIQLKATRVMQEKYKRPLSWLAEDIMIKPIVAILQSYKEMKNAKTDQIKKILKDLIADEMKSLEKKREILKDYNNIGYMEVKT